MNLHDWISLAVFLVVVTVSFFMPEVVRVCVFRSLQPLLKRICPVFNMTPWLFEPIDKADLPRRQRDFFNQHTTAFLAEGYVELGNFVLRRDRELSCVRYFLSPDRTGHR